MSAYNRARGGRGGRGRATNAAAPRSSVIGRRSPRTQLANSDEVNSNYAEEDDQLNDNNIEQQITNDIRRSRRINDRRQANGDNDYYEDEMPTLNEEERPEASSIRRRGSPRQNGQLNNYPNGSSQASNTSDATVEAMIKAITTVIDAPRPTKYNVPLPSFDGDLDQAYDFIEEYETAATINGWDDNRKLKFFSVALTKSAKIWFRGIDQSQLTWTELKRLYNERYLPKDRQRSAYQRFATAKQKTDESATEFMSRVVKLKRDTNQAVPDEEVISVVKEGLLNRDYRMAIMINSQTLNQVMELLKELDKLDKADKDKDKEKPDKSATKVSKPKETEAITGYRRRYGYQLDQSRAQPANNYFTRDNKNRFGPNRGFRPYNNRRRYQFNRFQDPNRSDGCWSCGAQDHLRRDCPKFIENDRHFNEKVKTEPRDGATHNKQTNASPSQPRQADDNNNKGKPNGGKLLCKALSEVSNENTIAARPENWRIGGQEALCDLTNECLPDRAQYEPVPLVNATVAGHIVTALCDSGSSATVINSDFAHKRGLIIVKWIGIRFRAIDSRWVSPTHVAKGVEVIIKGRKFYTDAVLIDDLWPTVVLGSDCLTEMGLVAIHPLRTVAFLDDPMLVELIELGRRLKSVPRYITYINADDDTNHVTNECYAGIAALFGESEDNQCETEKTLEAHPVKEVTLDPFVEYIVRFKTEEDAIGRYVTEAKQHFAQLGLEVWPTYVENGRDFQVVLLNKSLIPINITTASRPVILTPIEPLYQILSSEDYLNHLKTDNNNKTEPNRSETREQSKGKCIEITREEFINSLSIGEQLTPEERAKAEELLIEYRDRFYFKGDDMGHISIWKHRIDTNDQAPINQPPYRTSAKEKELIEQLVKAMLEEKAIRPSCSPWASPIVLVPKKGGGTRFCVNYKALNAITKSDVWPMPTLEDAFECLGGNDLFSTLDGSQMFWQIPVEEDSVEKTAFVCHVGLFEFTSMPYGLKNSPSSCARVMNIVFAQEMRKLCYSYIDDLITYSQGFQEHLDRLKIIMNRLREFGIKLNPKKCQFFKTSVVYLSHVISKEGIKPDPNRLKALSELPRPRTVREVKAFVNSLGWYRRFIENFAKIAEPLNRLTRTRDKTQFEWGPEQEEAFVTLKQKFVSPPVIVHYDSTKTHELRTDASIVGLGALLVQYNGNELEGLVCAVSRQVRGAETKYPPTELECLCIVWAIRKLRPYIHGKSFRIATDCHALCTLLKRENGNLRLARWSLELQMYTFEIVYRSGAKHTDADLLSRCPLIDNEDSEDSDCGGRFLTYSLAKHCDWMDISKTMEGFDIVREQRADPHWRLIYDKLVNQDSLGVDPKYSRYILVNDKLFYEDSSDDKPIYRLCVPKRITETLIRAAHDVNTSGHLGRNKVFGRLRSKYFWPQMYTQISNYVRSCQACQRVKVPNYDRRGPILPMNIGTSPMSVVSIDLVGKLPETNRGNKYVLTMNCTFTKFAIAVAIPDATSATVIKEIEARIVLVFGAPEVIHSDNAIGLDSAECRVFYRRYDIKHTKTVSFRPQANGITENFNKFVGQNLAIYAKSRKDWDLCVPFLAFAYNSSVNAVTGKTPLFMLIGHDAKMTIDRLIGFEKLMINDPDHDERLRILDIIRKKAKQAIKISQDRRKTRAQSALPKENYEMGDQVMLMKQQMKRKVGGKLLPKYYGPYRIIGRINPSVYIIMTTQGPESVDIVHIERLKRFYEREDKPLFPKDQNMPILEAVDGPWSHEELREDSDVEMPSLEREVDGQND